MQPSSSSRSPPLPGLFLLTRAQTSISALRDTSMDLEITPDRELVLGLRILDHTAHDRDPQVLHLAGRHKRVVHARHAPMQVLPQVRLHGLVVLQVHLPGVGLQLKRARQRDGARDDAARARAERRGGFREGREDGVGADEVGFEGPACGVRVEVAEEDVDEEGGLEGHLFDADVGDPFPVVARGQSFRGCGDVGGGGGARGDTGGDGGGEGLVGYFGGGGGGDRTAGGWLVASGMHAALLGDFFAGRGAVEFVHGYPGGGGGSAAGFRIVVAEGGGVAGGLGGPEVAGGIAAERFERGIFVDFLAGYENSGAVLDRLAVHPAIGVDGLPDGEEAVNVGVVQPKDGVESRIVDL